MIDLDVLRFSADELTQTQRHAPQLQLRCVGEYCDSTPLDSVLCMNAGVTIDIDQFGMAPAIVHWVCNSFSLPWQLDFASITISCEGLESDTDLFIAPISCGLVYTLGFSEQQRMLRKMRGEHSDKEQE